jgi:hypothetical protein
VLQTLNHL